MRFEDKYDEKYTYKDVDVDVGPRARDGRSKREGRSLRVELHDTRYPTPSLHSVPVL